MVLLPSTAATFDTKCWSNGAGKAEDSAGFGTFQMSGLGRSLKAASAASKGTGGRFSASCLCLTVLEEEVETAGLQEAPSPTDLDTSDARLYAPRNVPSLRVTCSAPDLSGNQHDEEEPLAAPTCGDEEEGATPPSTPGGSDRGRRGDPLKRSPTTSFSSSTSSFMPQCSGLSIGVMSSDGLCEWPSVATGLDVAHRSARLSSEGIAVSADAGQEEPEEDGIPDYLREWLPFGEDIPLDDCTGLYLRRASRSNCDFQEDLVASLRAPIAGAGTPLCSSSSSKAEGSVPGRVLKNLNIHGNAFRLGTASKLPACRPAETLLRTTSVGSDLDASPRNTLDHRHSIFHTKRVLEAAMQQSQYQLQQPTVSLAEKLSICCDPGGIGPLLSALRNSQGEHALLPLLDALHYMTFSPSICQILADIGGLQTLQRALDTPDSMAVGARVASILQHIASASDSLRSRLVDIGVVPGLVHLLQLGCVDSQTEAIRCLATLCDSREHCAVVQSAGALPTVLFALSNANAKHPSCHPLLRTGLQLLSRLAGCTAQARLALRVVGDSLKLACLVFAGLELWLRRAMLYEHNPFSPTEDQALLSDFAAQVTSVALHSTASEAAALDLGRNRGEEEAGDACLSDRSDKSFVQMLASTSAPRWRAYGDGQVNTMRRRRSIPQLSLMEPMDCIVGTDHSPPCSFRASSIDNCQKAPTIRIHSLPSCPVLVQMSC